VDLLHLTGWVQSARHLTDETFDDFVNAVAATKRFGAGELAWLARQSSAPLRMGVALNPLTSVATLTKLIKDESLNVRALAATNTNTPVELLVECWEEEKAWMLANPSLVDANHRVVLGYARDESVPLNEWLDALDHALVRGGLADNHRTPAEVYAEMVGIEKDERVLSVIATQRHTTEATFIWLTVHGDRTTRLFVASNPSVNGDVLRLLAYDRDGAVRAAAAAHDNCPPDLREHILARQ